MKVDEIIEYFKSVGTQKNIDGQARFGINASKSFGASQPEIRAKAKEINKALDKESRHKLAQELWDSGYRETYLLAGMIDVPELVTEKQMDSWVLNISSWDVCDTVTGTLFDKTPFAVSKAFEYSKRKEEFVKRTGFVLMAWLVVHNKKLPDTIFVQFLKVIKNSAQDERNFVKKAINWALRQIGKSQNIYLYNQALKVSDELRNREDKSERWVGSNAYNELLKMKSRFN